MDIGSRALPHHRNDSAEGRFGRFVSRIRKFWILYVFLIPSLVYVALFNYAPMYGVLMAFKNFKPAKGILGSEWVGWYNFERLFHLGSFDQLLLNTVTLSLYSLVAGFIFPVLLAVLLNTNLSRRFTRIIQTVTYMPHFLSTVVMVGIINLLLSPTMGLISQLLNAIGVLHGPLMVLLQNSAFFHIYVWSGVWQSIGWGSIIYIAALSGVDPSLHEAAVIDGANKFQRVRHIDIPWIMPTIVIVLILSCGGLLNVGFEKVYLMQNAMNLDSSEIISTYVYKIGILDAQYSFAAAVGLFNSVVNMTLLVLVNWISRRLGDTGLM